jgi:hypothetical protein
MSSGSLSTPVPGRKWAALYATRFFHVDALSSAASASRWISTWLSWFWRAAFIASWPVGCVVTTMLRPRQIFRDLIDMPPRSPQTAPLRPGPRASSSGHRAGARVGNQSSDCGRSLLSGLRARAASATTPTRLARYLFGIVIGLERAGRQPCRHPPFGALHQFLEVIV